MQGAQHAVSGQCSLHGNGGGFRIPDLADHDDIRILAQNRAQTAGKGHAGLAVELDLANFFDTVLHRVFHRDDIDVRLVDLFQYRIQAGAFAAAGGTGAQNHAMGPVDHGFKPAMILFAHAQPFQGKNAGAGVQQTQDHVLAVNGGDRGSPDIDVFVFHFDGETPVLGNSGDGDVHVGQNFQPRDDRQKHRLGWRRYLMQPAVHPKANLHVIFFRTDMDIAGPLAHPLG